MIDFNIDCDEIVLDNRYVVVLQLTEREGYDFECVTAFVTSVAYLQEIRRGYDGDYPGSSPGQA